jgi:hypothetical protein
VYPQLFETEKAFKPFFFSSELKFRVRAGKKRYLDVWPVNFLTAEDTDVTDNTSLFLFQLACIVNMVSFLVSLSSVSCITSLLIVTPHH